MRDKNQDGNIFELFLFTLHLSYSLSKYPSTPPTKYKEGSNTLRKIREFGET